MLAGLMLLISFALAGSPAPLIFSAAEEATLAKGEVVIRDSGKGMVVAVIDVDATPAKVWPEVLDIERRVEEVGSSTGCEVYHRSDDPLKAKWGIGMMGVSASFHLIYTIDSASMVMSYTIDESKENDVAYAVGSYQVLSRGDVARIIYRSEADPKSKVPGWLRSLLTGRPLRQQLGGIRARAERQ